MGHRLSKIVTRTGDAGTTGLGDGSRVAKDAARIDAIGAVDELNSTIGVLLAEIVQPAAGDIATTLVDVQHDLFDLGGELSIPGYAAVTEAHVVRLEDGVERYNATSRRSRSSCCRAARARRRSRTSRAPCAAAPSARSFTSPTPRA
jgi:cob(I)alamin adenosyltransferase